MVIVKFSKRFISANFCIILLFANSRSAIISPTDRVVMVIFYIVIVFFMGYPLISILLLDLYPLPSY